MNAIRKYICNIYKTYNVHVSVQDTDRFMLDTGDGQTMGLPVDDAWGEQSRLFFDFHI